MPVHSSAWKLAAKAVAEEIHDSYVFMDEAEPTITNNEYIKGIDTNELVPTPFLHPCLLNSTPFYSILSFSCHFRELFCGGGTLGGRFGAWRQ
jgi:hypothetical protein